jgi:prepilin-type N-terminal cleavage/methylation domain-containing protein
LIRWLRLRLRGEHGVTLIEMIMVLAILGIVLGGVTTVFISGSRAELNVNNRFQAQEAARIGLAAVRKDLHGACVASVDTTINPGKLMTLSIPTIDKTTNTAPDATMQCGLIISTMTKVFWVICTSPTNPAKFALYRATAASTCPSSGKLVADNLVNNLTGFAGFFQITRLLTTPTQSVGSLYMGEVQTVDVDIPVNLKVGTLGQPFDLKERMALPNTVWSKAATQSCSAAVPCFRGPCSYTDMASGAVMCFPPLIAP